MPSLSLVGGATAPSTDLSDPQSESALSDVSEAYAYLEQCRERAERAKSILVECVLDARRMHGAKLADVAEAMGVSRQYVQKLVREAERGEDLAEQEAAYYEREARKDERTHMRGLGFTPADRQCGVCHRFKSAPSAVCEFCGDDPVTYNGERRDFDAAYAGGVR